MEEFRRLYETVYQDLYRLAYYYLGNAADAEDAVQDTAAGGLEGLWEPEKERGFPGLDPSDLGQHMPQGPAEKDGGRIRGSCLRIRRRNWMRRGPGRQRKI